jgi:glycosyltransferase involved in cell wall biosynthesis
MTDMRVAQIAPLFESVPPKEYGGTERVVYYLTEELIRRGHEVTLFASGDSQTNAKLIPGCEKSLRVHAEKDDANLLHMLMLEEVRKRAEDFDVIHFHLDYLQYPFIRTLHTPSLTTLHGRLDLKHYDKLYEEYAEANLISISESQRSPLPWCTWRGTVYHGLPKDLYKFKLKPKGYAAFLGRISPEKRPDRAIQICKRAGIPLVIAAKVSAHDIEYFENVIQPMIDESHDVEFIGEINDHEKESFLGNAKVALFPIDWPEPFGLVMIEALACGTPVLGWRNGSVPEIIKHNQTGFIVDNLEDAIRSIDRVDKIDRKTCRKDFEDRFSIEVMTDNYLRIYESISLDHKYVGLRPRPFEMPTMGWDAWKTSSSTPITST